MMSALPEGRSRWIVISDVSSWSSEWHSRGGFPLVFLCRQWDMNGCPGPHIWTVTVYTLAFTSLSTIEWLNSYAVQDVMRIKVTRKVRNPSLPIWDLNRGPLGWEPSMLPLVQNCALLLKLFVKSGIGLFVYAFDYCLLLTLIFVGLY